MSFPFYDGAISLMVIHIRIIRTMRRTFCPGIEGLIVNNFILSCNMVALEASFVRCSKTSKILYHFR